MAEQHVSRVHTGEPVLDIGGDIGALILYVPGRFVGKEIEVSPVGEDQKRTHTDVHERLAAGRTLFTAIYPALQAGEYTILGLDGQPAGTATIVGGQVTEMQWPAP